MMLVAAKVRSRLSNDVNATRAVVVVTSRASTFAYYVGITEFKGPCSARPGRAEKRPCAHEARGGPAACARSCRGPHADRAPSRRRVRPPAAHTAREVAPDAPRRHRPRRAVGESRRALSAAAASLTTRCSTMSGVLATLCLAGISPDRSAHYELYSEEVCRRCCGVRCRAERWL